MVHAGARARDVRNSSPRQAKLNPFYFDTHPFTGWRFGSLDPHLDFSVTAGRAGTVAGALGSEAFCTASAFSLAIRPAISCLTTLSSSSCCLTVLAQLALLLFLSSSIWASSCEIWATQLRPLLNEALDGRGHGFQLAFNSAPTL